MKLSTKPFTFDKKTGGFVAEASDFCRTNQRLFHQIYPDACDEGITLISHQTGIEVDYYVEHTETDREGEIQYWLLKPTPESIRKVPRARNTYVRIFND